MSIGFSTCGDWGPLRELKEIETEDQGKPWFDDAGLNLDEMEAAWVVLDPEKAPRYLSFTIGGETEEYLFSIDLTGAIPVLEDEDGRVLYIKKKGGEKDVERTAERRVGQNTQAL